MQTVRLRIVPTTPQQSAESGVVDEYQHPCFFLVAVNPRSTDFEEYLQGALQGYIQNNIKGFWMESDGTIVYTLHMDRLDVDSGIAQIRLWLEQVMMKV